MDRVKSDNAWRQDGRSGGTHAQASPDRGGEEMKGRPSARRALLVPSLCLALLGGWVPAARTETDRPPDGVPDHPVPAELPPAGAPPALPPLPAAPGPSRPSEPLDPPTPSVSLQVRVPAQAAPGEELR